MCCINLIGKDYDKWKSRINGPFIVNEVFAGGAIEVVDLGDAHTFFMKGEKLRSYGGCENASKKASQMLAEPLIIESS